MGIKQKTVDFLTEVLKFPIYSKEEVKIQNPEDTSKTSIPQQEEYSYLNYDPFASYSSGNFGQQQVWSANKNDMLRKWREASYLPEVDSAINEIANEAIVYDEIEDAIKINLSDIEIPDLVKQKITESFNNILYMLDFNERGDEIFKQWYVDGQLNIEAVYNNDRIRNGIQKLVLLSPFNFNSYIDPKDNQKKYYYGELNSNNVTHNKKTKDIFLDEQITSINSGLWSMDKKFPISYLNKSIKTINQLCLIEDSLVIMRITKSTEKRAFYIPTGNLNKAKGEEYLRSLINKYRQKKIYNMESGTIENKNRSISILEDFWFPVDKSGSSPRVENIAGTAPGFTSFEDVDYFINKVYKSLNIPLNRRAPDSRFTINNSIDIEKDELRFFKFILKLRRKFNNLFVDLLKKDLLAKKVLTLSDWNLIQEKIKFIYANSNEYSEIKNNQILSMKIDTANASLPLIESELISLEWIQDNILRFTDEEKQKIKEQQAQNQKKSSEEINDLNDIEHNFGNDYSVRKRNSFSPELPTEETKPEETNLNIPSEEITAKENKIQKKENILTEKINYKTFLNILKDGDIITNGEIKLEYKNGELVEII